jgi:hypothetical protein
VPRAEFFGQGGVPRFTFKDAEIYLRVKVWCIQVYVKGCANLFYGCSRIVSENYAVFHLSGDQEQPMKSCNMRRHEGTEGGGLRFRVWVLDAEPLQA